MSVDFNEALTRKTISVFSEEFRNCVVQFKSTDKHNDGLYYRFFYNGNKDLTTLAIKQQLISNQHKGLDLQSLILRAFPGSSRAGLDFHVYDGLAKEWTFTSPVPIEQFITTLSNELPQALVSKLDFFKQHKLRHAFFIAVDFINDKLGWMVGESGLIIRDAGFQHRGH